MLQIILFRSLILYFNSIKVRLELTVEREEGDPQVFQFHKGTIRTKSPFLIASTKLISIP